MRKHRSSLEFSWSSQPGGFEWTERKPVLGKGQSCASSAQKQSPEPGLLLTTVRRTGETWTTWQDRVYYPQDVSDLYLEFARTAPTPEGIAAFANKYGVLGIGKYYCGRFPNLDSTIDEVFGESMENWVQEIAFMKLTVDAWDALKSHDLVRLRNAAATAETDANLFEFAQFPSALRVGWRGLLGDSTQALPDNWPFAERDRGLGGIKLVGMNIDAQLDPLGFGCGFCFSGDVGIGVCFHNSV